MIIEKLWQIAIIGFIFLTSILVSYFKMSRGDTTIKVLDNKDKLIMLVLMLLYAVISFINLGRTYDYSVWNGDYQGKEFEINLSTPKQLSSIYYYMGFGEGNMEG